MEMENELLHPFLAVPVRGFDLYYKGSPNKNRFGDFENKPQSVCEHILPHIPPSFSPYSCLTNCLPLACLNAPGSILDHRASLGKHRPCSCCREHTLNPSRGCTYRLEIWKTVKSALEGGVGIVSVLSRDFWRSLNALHDPVQSLLHHCLPVALPWCGWKEKHVVCQVQLWERVRPSLLSRGAFPHTHSRRCKEKSRAGLCRN